MAGIEQQSSAGVLDDWIDWLMAGAGCWQCRSSGLALTPPTRTHYCCLDLEAEMGDLGGGPLLAPPLPGELSAHPSWWTHRPNSNVINGFCSAHSHSCDGDKSIQRKLLTATGFHRLQSPVDPLVSKQPKKQDATRGGNEWEDSWRRISLKRASASSTYPPPWDPEKALASCNSFRRFAGARPFRNAAQRRRWIVGDERELGNASSGPHTGCRAWLDWP